MASERPDFAEVRTYPAPAGTAISTGLTTGLPNSVCQPGWPGSVARSRASAYCVGRSPGNAKPAKIGERSIDDTSAAASSTKGLSATFFVSKRSRTGTKKGLVGDLLCFEAETDGNQKRACRRPSLFRSGDGREPKGWEWSSCRLGAGPVLPECRYPDLRRPGTSARCSAREPAPPARAEIGEETGSAACAPQSDIVSQCLPARGLLTLGQ